MILLGEISVFCILIGLLLNGPALGTTLWIILAVGTAFSLLPITDRQKELRQDRIAFLIVLLLTVCAMGTGQWTSPAAYLIIVPAGLLAVLGVVQLLAGRRRGEKWSGLRVNLTWSGLITVVSVSLVAGLARAALTFRSHQPIEPGRVDFLINLLVVAAIWLGLDAHLRVVQRPKTQSPLTSLWDRRHSLGMLVVLAINLAGRWF